MAGPGDAGKPYESDGAVKRVTWERTLALVTGGDWLTFAGWCIASGTPDPHSLSPALAVAAYTHMVYASGNKEMIAQFEMLVEPPNEINPETGVPDWYGSDEEAWDQFNA